MESLAYLVPAEVHHGKEGAFKEESEYSLNGKRSSEYIPHKPGIIAPVCSELELQDYARGNAAGKVYGKDPAPELSQLLPGLVVCPVIFCLEDCYQDSQSQCKRHKQPVVHGRERELQSRSVYK